MNSFDSLAPHPIGSSHFADGQIPNAPGPTPANADGKIYIQPTVEVQQVPEGARITDNRPKSFCQRLAEEKNAPAVSEWFQRNKGIIGWIGLGYLTVRILTRSNN